MKSWEVSSDQPLARAFKRVRSSFWAVGLFSCAMNVLMLTGPLFMLQVYDRVLASRSLPTLAVLFALVFALYFFLGIFDFVRSRLLSRAGFRLDADLMALARTAALHRRSASNSSSASPAADLSVMRQFIGSNGLPALFDLPWIPVYLVVVYLLHTWLGLLATIGALLVVFATVATELLSRNPVKLAGYWERRDSEFAEQADANADAVVAMGMTEDVTRHWKSLRHNALAWSQQAAERTQSVSSIVKSFRLLLQSAILALGALLAIRQEITPGTMIAASILAGRALAPVDLALANWRNFVRARQSLGRLSKELQHAEWKVDKTSLPVPVGKLSVSGVTKFAPQRTQVETKPLLQGIQFELEPGDGLGVIGPSASGKSSLGRLLVGLWIPDRGSVRFDGATFEQWDRKALGRFVGYLPQSVRIMPGTARQYIARYDSEVPDDEVVAAAKLASVHEMILGLPNGYDTELGRGGLVLSGGQMQRMALACAVLRVPPLVVLDEPNSNLDAEGDAALTKAILQLREAGSCVVVMAHRPSAVAAVNKILVLREGRQTQFGSRDEVLRGGTTIGPVDRVKVSQ